MICRPFKGAFNRRTVIKMPASYWACTDIAAEFSQDVIALINKKELRMAYGTLRLNIAGIKMKKLCFIITPLTVILF